MAVIGVVAATRRRTSVTRATATATTAAATTATATAAAAKRSGSGSGSGGGGGDARRGGDRAAPARAADAVARADERHAALGARGRDRREDLTRERHDTP